MHELGVVMEVIKTLDRIVLENNLKQVDTIVLQIGEISSMMPKYIEDCYDVAVDGTQFVENEGKCEFCKSNDWELLSGKEFLIKEIIAC